MIVWLLLINIYTSRNPCIAWKERRLALPLTRMEEALRPDNMQSVKALPPTPWHLTTVLKKKKKEKKYLAIQQRSGLLEDIYTCLCARA